MELAVPLVLWLLAFIFFIMALYDEREEVVDEGDEERSDHLIVIFLMASSIMFFIGGVCMMYISEWYYSPVSDTIVEVLMPSYRPLMYIGLSFFFITLSMLVAKVFHILGYEMPWEG